MTENRSFYLLVSGLCIVLLAASASMTADMFGMYREKSIALSLKPARRINHAMASIDKALLLSLPVPIKSTDTLQASPFGPENPSGNKMPGIGRKPVQSCGLVLKGVLNKDIPLAIIQNQAGQTFICTSGDTICSMKLVSINFNVVELKGRNGSIKLSISEESPITQD